MAFSKQKYFWHLTPVHSFHPLIQPKFNVSYVPDIVLGVKDTAMGTADENWGDRKREEK